MKLQIGLSLFGHIKALGSLCVIYGGTFTNSNFSIMATFFTSVPFGRQTIHLLLFKPLLTLQ